MKKLKLHIQAVEVETFATVESRGEPRGTVEGAQLRPTLQPSCFGDCPFTQNYSCEGYGCTQYGDPCVA